MTDEKYARDVLSPEYNFAFFSGRYFELCNLQSVVDITPAHIFGEEDFRYFTPGPGGRTPVTAKLGKLLITFCPGGKNAFELNIQFIDTGRQQTRPLFLYTGDRYPSFTFEDLVPVPLSTNYPDRTYTSPPDHYTQEKRNACDLLKLRARAVRACLVELALGHEQNEFPMVTAAFIAAKHAYDSLPVSYQPHPPRQQQQQAVPDIHSSFWDPVPPEININSALDVQEFGQEQIFANRKPRNIKELAAKLAASFYSSFGVDDESFKNIIGEYLEETHQKIRIFDDECIQSILDSMIDKGRYPFKTVVPEDPPGSTFRRLINEMKLVQPAQRTSTTIISTLPIQNSSTTNNSTPPAQDRTFATLIASFNPHTETGKVVYSTFSTLAAEINRFKLLSVTNPLAQRKLDILVSYQTRIASKLPEPVISDATSQRVINLMIQEWRNMDQNNQARAVLHQDRDTKYAVLRGVGFLTVYLLPLLAFITGLVAKQSVQTGRAWAAVFAPRGMGLFGSQTQSERTMLSVVDSLESHSNTV